MVLILDCNLEYVADEKKKLGLFKEINFKNAAAIDLNKLLISHLRTCF